MKLTGFFLTLVSIFFLMGGIMAQDVVAPLPLPHPGHGPKFGLDLTEDQKTKMADLKLSLKKQIIPLKSELNSLHSELKLVMTADKFDKNTAEKIVNKLSNIHKDMHMMRILHKQAVRSMLTAEQRKKFDMHILSGKGPRKRPGGFRGDHFGPPRHPGREHGFRN